MRSVSLVLFLTAAVMLQMAAGDSVQLIRTKTNSCLTCGMATGDVSIKVCGNIGCCLTLRIDNNEANFNSGKLDEFSGPATLKECDNFQIGDKNLGRIQISLAHEGTDGLELEYVEIETDERVVRCPINTELDADNWLQALCT